jgi:hypothetical protein
MRGEHNSDADDINSSIHILNQPLGTLGARQADQVEVAGQDQENEFRVEFHGGLQP